MDELRFDIKQNAAGAAVVTPVINGRPLPELVGEFERERGFADPTGGYDGIIPEFIRYGPLDEYFLGRARDWLLTNPQRIYVLGCECGEVGCWPLIATVEVDDGAVRWSQFEQPHRSKRDYSGLGPFEFEKGAYQRSLAPIASLT